MGAHVFSGQGSSIARGLFVFGEFVDFVDLLPKRPSQQEAALTSLTESGRVVVLQSVRQVRRRRGEITYLPSWLEAFAVFVAMWFQERPQLVPMLMSFGASIILRQLGSISLLRLAVARLSL